MDQQNIETNEEIEEEKKETPQKKKNAIEALKFLCFSLSAGLIQIGSDALMLEVLHFKAWLSYLIALILSVLWNFTLNRKYTFHSASNVPIAMLKVAIYYAVFTPLSTWWTHQLVDVALWNEYLVLGITMVINFITEFLYQKFYVFRK